MRLVTATAMLAALLTAATAASAADKCTVVKATSLQMVRSPGDGRDLLPVTVAGANKLFLFDTGGYETQIGRAAAQELNLAIFSRAKTLAGLTGRTSPDAARVPGLSIGGLSREKVVLPISPNIGFEDGAWFDGLVALDYLGTGALDIEVDFGSDMFNVFSPDHCPGGVVYWPAPAVAILPIINTEGNHINVPITLDGHKFNALIDTGASISTLRIGLAQDLYGLTMGSADTPAFGAMNGDKSFQTYRHVFKSMSFGDIAVNNPRVELIPGGSISGTPEMILGMDVLRKLHIYFAFHEGKMYITPASVQTPEQKALQASLIPTAALQAAFKRQIPGRIAALDKTLAANPNDSAALNNRCFERATIKSDLNAALADCDQSVRLKPDSLNLDSRAFVLYQQGKYQDALTAYDAALAADPKQSESLFMRGHARGKLGDAAGMAADIAAAKAIKPEVEGEFRAYDVDL